MVKLKLGKAFIDEVSKVSSSSGHFSHKKDSKSFEESFIYGFKKEENPASLSYIRVYLFIFIIIIAFFALFLRLFHLQVVKGSENREIADSNRIQIKIIHAPRGVIYDRSGKILAQNEPGFRLVEVNDKGQTKTTYLNRDQALKLEISNDPKVNNLEVDNLRFYPQAEKSSHIVGFVGEISEDELKNPDNKKYQIGDRIGRGGVEEVYEDILKGTDGGEVIEVDAQGRKIRALRQSPPTPGQNLYLTIDKDLQEFTYQRLIEGVGKTKSCCGAAVAQDPNTGEILALVSIPSFHPSELENSLSNPDSPFLNRVISGVYPPGSIFKIVSSVAGLSSGKITPSTVIEDTGQIFLGPFKFTNWYFTQYGRTEGSVDMVKALKRSNDIYFYRIGQIIGEKAIADTAKKVGLGKKLGIDLPGEEAGLIPDNDWKVKKMGEIWYPGDTLHMSIGQGFVLTTPLQLNTITSVVAANGSYFPPHLASKFTTADGELVKEFKYEPNNVIEFDKSKLKVIKKGLEEVTLNGGTAWPFFSFPIKTAGKTGTAEYGDPNKTHAWYTAYAPVDNPTIAITVLVEGGGEGSTNASPIVKEILRWYLSPDKTNLIKDIFPIATESAKTLGE